MHVIARVVLLIGVAIATAAQAVAQTAPPQGGGWSPDNESYWNAPGARYHGSAVAACKALFEHFEIAESGHSFLGLKEHTGRTAACDWTNAVGVEFLPYVVPPGVTSFVCPDGQKVRATGGTGVECVADPVQACDECVTDVSGLGSLAGNPINVEDGGKVHSRTDFASQDGRFRIRRKYRSTPGNGEVYRNRTYSELGPNWSFSDELYLNIDSMRSDQDWSATVVDRGRVVSFSHFGAQGTFGQGSINRNGSTGNSGEGYRLSVSRPAPLKSGAARPWQGQPIHFRMTDSRGRTIDFETFSPSFGDTDEFRPFTHARPTRIAWPDGYVQTRGYGSRGELLTLRDNLGRSALFRWALSQKGIRKPDGTLGKFERRKEPEPQIPIRVVAVDLYDGSRIEYGYTESDEVVAGVDWDNDLDRLISMRRVDAETKESAFKTVIDSETYAYEEDERGRERLRSITDANGVAYNTISYDEEGRAVRSEHPGGADAVTVGYTFEDGFNDIYTRRVTNALGRASTYTYQLGPFRDDARQLVRVDGDAVAGVEGDTQSKAYGDGAGRLVTRYTDREGRTTLYAYDERGQRTLTVRASGTADEVRTETDWHPDIAGLKTEIREPGRTTRNTYSPSGKLVSQTVLDTRTGDLAARTTTFTHGPSHPFYPEAVDGPLPGPSDTTRLEWQGERLVSVTNALGHKTTYGAHTVFGLPGRVVDPNGVVTTLTYDTKHRLVEMVEDADDLSATTTMVYDGLDQLVAVDMPNGTRMRFEHDDARRLRAVENGAGERIEMDYNAMGGLVSTQVVSGTGTVEQVVTQLRDMRNRVVETAMPTAIGVVRTAMDLDTESNVTSVTDADGLTWRSGFDALDRVIESVDPEQGVTALDYEDHLDARDPLAGVTDPRGAATAYVRNGFGEVTSEISVEEGTTTYTHDERGLVTRMVDARGVVTDYAYDALGRLTAQTHPDAPEDDILYTYDEGENGVGRLTSIVEGFGTTTFTYNALGHMSAKTRELGGTTYTTRYTHDLSGEVLSTTYPSGRVVTLTRDAAVRVTAIATTDPVTGETVQLLSNVGYKAYGPMSGADYGDGHRLDITYDQSLRAVSLRRAGADGALIDTGFTHDGRGNITAITDRLDASRSQSFTYDGLSRLTRADGSYGGIAYTYNAGGDRTARVSTYVSGADTLTRSEAYAYDPDSFRLDNVTLLGNAGDRSLRTFTYDASGRPVEEVRGTVSGDADSAFTYAYNARGRLTGIARDGASVAAYAYDDTQQRIAKTAAGPGGADATTYYHYDARDRLIAETDASGATLREYVWLGLMPVAVIAPVDSEPPLCDDDLVADLQARLDRLNTRLPEVEARLADVAGRLDARTDAQTTREERLAEREAARIRLADLLAATDPANTERVDDLTTRLDGIDARIAELEGLLFSDGVALSVLEARVGELQARRDHLVTRVSEVGERLARVRAHLADGERVCAGGTDGGDDGGMGTNPSGLHYLHADHLGRPVIATAPTGEVVWRSALLTPFGDDARPWIADQLDGTARGEALAALDGFGSLSQGLLFPGQYVDAETRGADALCALTTLAHNHNRTYDPALGRYLTPDPIGLAGGLNRYAYVGGNPVAWVDPRGLNYEPYNGTGTETILKPWLVGMEAHSILAGLAAGQRGWRANSAWGKYRECRFRGRPDLIHDTSSSVWELKPNNPNSIAKGKVQVQGYTKGRNNFYSVGGLSPSSLGFRGLEKRYRGKYGRYKFQFEGDGVISYNFIPNVGSTMIYPVPWILPSFRDSCDFICVSP